MKREEFIKSVAKWGLGTVFLPSLLSSCQKDPALYNFKGKVIIIGAGAAGMMAGYNLKKNGIDFQIIEASNEFGGRVRELYDFADFPIDIGAEWVHDTPKIFKRLINDPDIKGSIDLIPYNPATIYDWEENQLTRSNWKGPFYGEYKFKHSTWYDFFQDFIIPSIRANTILNYPVISIDYNSDQVQVTTRDRKIHKTDRVIVTVPTSILKQGLINFTPELPQVKLDSLEEAFMPDGMKVFIEFSERFYPDLITSDLPGSTYSDEKVYYDAAFKKESKRHILGLFTIGKGAAEYNAMRNETEIISAILSELDAMFDGKANQYYIKHYIQNWSKEPFIKGSYTFFDSKENEHRSNLQKPLDGKVYFAGEALSNYSSATVHGAGLSGIEVVNNIMMT